AKDVEARGRVPHHDEKRDDHDRERNRERREHEDKQGAPSRKIELRERVPAERAEEHGKRCGCTGDEEAVSDLAECAELAEQRPVVLERPVLRQEGVAGENLLEGFQRRAEHPDERKNHEDRCHGQERVGGELGGEASRSDGHQRPRAGATSRRLTSRNWTIVTTTMIAKYA